MNVIKIWIVISIGKTKEWLTSNLYPAEDVCSQCAWGDVLCQVWEKIHRSKSGKVHHCRLHTSACWIIQVPEKLMILPLGTISINTQMNTDIMICSHCSPSHWSSSSASLGCRGRCTEAWSCSLRVVVGSRPLTWSSVDSTQPLCRRKNSLQRETSTVSNCTWTPRVYIPSQPRQAPPPHQENNNQLSSIQLNPGKMSPQS